MEEIFTRILKDINPLKFPQLSQNCQDAQALLTNQHELMRVAPFEVREKCLCVLQAALESKNSKLISHAVKGFQEIVRDKSFQASFEIEDEEKWLPSQLIKALVSTSSLQDEIQVDILKILLQMAYTSGWYLSIFGVLQLLQLYCDVYSKGSVQVKTAAQAAASQTLQAFCSYIKDADAQNRDDNSEDSESEGMNPADLVIEDILPALKFLCDKLKKCIDGQEDKIVTTLLLQCLHSIFNSLLYGIHNNKDLKKFVWQELCPVLISVLGSPKADKKNITSQRNSVSDKREMGRGSGCLNAAPSCLSSNAKTVYALALELVRLFGSVASFRPVLGSLFHQMLLYPPAQHRIEVLKSMKELLKRTNVFVLFAAPPLHDIDQKNSRSSDLDLLKIVMDSLSQCSHSQESVVCYASVSCVLALLTSLEKIMEGDGLAEEHIQLINKVYKSLDEVKPLTVDVPKTSKDELDKDSLEEDPSESLKDDLISRDSTPEPFISCEEQDDGIKKELSQQDSFSDADDEASDSLERNDNEEGLKSTELGPQFGKETQIISELVENVTPELKSIDVNVTAELKSIDVNVNTGIDENDQIKNGDGIEMDRLSLSSGITEGPEDKDEDFDELDRLFEEQEKQKELEESARRSKAPRTLLGCEDGTAERERVEKLCESHDAFAQLERYNAQHFIEVLIDLLPSVLCVKSSIEADQSLQEFASKYCEDLWKTQGLNQNHAFDNEINSRPVTIVNADGIYLATFSTLLLNLKLIKKGYYERKGLCGKLMSELEFIEEVHGSGVLVYLSATWLSEVYQQIMARNILKEGGYDYTSIKNSSIINLLTDIDGLGSTEQGGQLLSDYRRLERAVSGVHSSPGREAGMKFVRRVLTSSWDILLDVLSVLLNGTNACGITDNLGLILGTEGAKEDHRRAQEAVAESLDALKISARLCNLLGLQSSCGAVFAQLAVASCPVSQDSLLSYQTKSNERSQRLKLKKNVLSGWSKTIRLHPSHILSLDVILNKGLELGSHSPHCWKHVFRCCLYVMSLEHAFFTIHPQSSIPSLKSTVNKLINPSKSDTGETGLYLPSYSLNESDDFAGIDLSFIPGSPKVQDIPIYDLIKQANESGGVLKDKQLQPILEGLSQMVDKLFEDAANRLNLSSLITFLAELCAASQEQLFSQSASIRNIRAPLTSHTNLLLMCRLADVMLRCSRGGRPIIHVMKAWSVVAPHFVEAACHKEQAISKRSVASIHDIVSALLSAHPELPHFHFNEALFKPLENLLCLELCDMDVQEQIVSSICEFVEGCTTDVRSGWRPLFGALRAVRISDPLHIGNLATSAFDMDREQARYLRVVLDVFNAFLGTENILVFANAAVDCLLCLLKHVRGPAELQDSQMPKMDDSGGDNPEAWSLDLCLAALKYLDRCSGILSFMYKMPACPVFNSAHRIQVHREPILVDPVLPNTNIISMTGDNNGNVKDISTVDVLSLNPLPQPIVTLDSLEHPTGILHVWFLLVEGLVGAVATCPKRYQPHTMETLFSLLNNLKAAPGPEFGMCCINHLLLPMLQNWLRRTTRVYRVWDNFATNFKQCSGLTTDLVVDYLLHLAEQGSLNESQGANLMFYQLLLVLTECVAQPVESVSRLGCACIRHVFTTAGHILTPDLWELACCCLERAFRLSLLSVQQLMTCFCTDSENFYGDVGQVKVAARKDCTSQESERLYQLAQQVFALDCQCNSSGNWSQTRSGVAAPEDRSFVFLLHPPGIETTSNPDLYIIRVPFRNVVVGLVSHQVLLQTLATVLLQGTTYMLPSLSSLLSNSVPLASPKRQSPITPTTPLPGFLSHLSTSHLEHLLSSLSESYTTACDFDSRPGLKFLIQKVAQSDVAANLYKQAGISWTVQALVLFELCMHDQTLTLDKVNKLLLPDGLQMPSTTSSAATDPGSDDENVTTDDSLENPPERLANRYIQEELNRNKTNGDETPKKDKTNSCNPYRRLRDTFYNLCNTYVEIVLDKEGTFSAVDRISDEPIFFLTVQPDDFPELQRSGSITKDQSSKTERSILRQSSVESTDSEMSDRPIVDDSTDRIYTVATEKTINSMMNEYKKRKPQHSLPSVRKDRPKKLSQDSIQSLPEEVEKQRKNSILKDSEARLQVWTQLLQSVLDLHLSLPEPSFHAMLPVIFPGVQVLVIYANDNLLRTTLANWLSRLALCCGFGSPLSLLTPES